MKLFDIKPHLGAQSAEPSLRQIILGYYKPHFDDEMAQDLTEKYIAEMRKHLLDENGIPKDVQDALDTIREAAEPARLIEKAHCLLGIADRRPIDRAIQKASEWAARYK